MEEQLVGKRIVKLERMIPVLIAVGTVLVNCGKILTGATFLTTAVFLLCLMLIMLKSVGQLKDGKHLVRIVLTYFGLFLATEALNSMSPKNYPLLLGMVIATASLVAWGLIVYRPKLFPRREDINLKFRSPFDSMEDAALMCFMFLLVWRFSSIF